MGGILLAALWTLAVVACLVSGLVYLTWRGR